VEDVGLQSSSVSLRLELLMLGNHLASMQGRIPTDHEQFPVISHFIRRRIYRQPQSRYFIVLTTPRAFLALGFEIADESGLLTMLRQCVGPTAYTPGCFPNQNQFYLQPPISSLIGRQWPLQLNKSTHPRLSPAY